MSVEAVRTVLVSAAPVTALVPAARIEPLRRTQSFATPAITLQRIAGIPTSHLRGSAGLMHHHVQLDVWAQHYSDALDIAAACRTALEALPHGFILESEIEGHESEPDPELARIIQTWSVFV
jgi:hypothetical protein